MKIYIVVTTHEDDMAEVEVFNTSKEATDFIRATIGDIVIDFQRDNCLEELLGYLADIKVSSDENGDIYYATFGPEGFKTWIEVVEKEVNTK